MLKESSFCCCKLIEKTSSGRLVCKVIPLTKRNILIASYLKLQGNNRFDAIGREV